jgi:hypothetical protein
MRSTSWGNEHEGHESVGSDLATVPRHPDPLMVAALNIAELASGQLTATDAVVIELIEADETPAAVIIR